VNKNWTRIRRQGATKLVGATLRTFSGLARRLPTSHPKRHNVEVLRDIPYLPSGQKEHTLDIYRPSGDVKGAPVVFYAHGGAFQTLSKKTHWLMGLAFAKQGYLVCNINYRLAPRYPYPAAMIDVCAACSWLVEHIHEYGGDSSKLILSGESAGANLVTALTLAVCYERTEAWARKLWDVHPQIRAVIPACGLLQVSDTQRFARRKKLPIWMADHIASISEAYLPYTLEVSIDFPLADPLLLLEGGKHPQRPLPPFFIPVGTKDPILDDSRRLKTALDRLGASSELRYYEGGVHAFHALLWQPIARQCWQEQFNFCRKQLATTND